MAAPPAPELKLEMRFECVGLDLRLGLVVPVKEGETVSVQKVVCAFWSAGILATLVDLNEEGQLEKFDHELEAQTRLRREQQQFFAQVQKCYTQTAEAMTTMKRDYYREVDHLREQLSRQRRDPDFEPDNVFFFEPGAYQIPSWKMLLDELDNSRMKREALSHELNADRLKAVPIHMVCEQCRTKFLEEEEIDSEKEFEDKSTGTDCAAFAGTEIAVQTDWTGEFHSLVGNMQAQHGIGTAIEGHGPAAHGSADCAGHLPMDDSRSTDGNTLDTSLRAEPSIDTLGDRPSEDSWTEAEELVDGLGHRPGGTSGQPTSSEDVDARRAGHSLQAEGSGRDGRAAAEGGQRSVDGATTGGSKVRAGSRPHGGRHAQGSHGRSILERPDRTQDGHREGCSVERGRTASIPSKRSRAGHSGSESGHSERCGETGGQGDLSDAARKMCAALQRLGGPRAESKPQASRKGAAASSRERHAAADQVMRGLEALKRHYERMAFGRLKHVLCADVPRPGSSPSPPPPEEGPLGVLTTRRLSASERTPGEHRMKNSSKAGSLADAMFREDATEEPRHAAGTQLEAGQRGQRPAQCGEFRSCPGGLPPPTLPFELPEAGRDLPGGQRRSSDLVPRRRTPGPPCRHCVSLEAPPALPPPERQYVSLEGSPALLPPENELVVGALKARSVRGSKRRPGSAGPDHGTEQVDRRAEPGQHAPVLELRLNVGSTSSRSQARPDRAVVPSSSALHLPSAGRVPLARGARGSLFGASCSPGSTQTATMSASAPQAQCPPLGGGVSRETSLPGTQR